MMKSNSPAIDEERYTRFQSVIRSRRSYRGFLSTPVANSTIVEVLEDAQHTPSNCNTQPWHVHVVSGSKLTELSRVLHAKNEAGLWSPDFSFDMEEYFGTYKVRQAAQSKAFYDAMEVARDDKVGRSHAASQNYSFFNAPHAAFLFMPSFGDNVRVASDIGMYGQSFLLSLTAHGLGGIPQTSLGFFAGAIREFLGASNELKMLFGISFGYPDDSAMGNRMRVGRAPLSETVTFHS